jgi:hypothetical protein
MSERDDCSSDSLAARTRDNDDLSDLWTKEEREQLVIVVPDWMETAPLDRDWIAKHNPFVCEIIHLGRPLGHQRFETSDELYRELISKMIAVGVKVINERSLAETNSRFLAAHPNAEGVRIRGNDTKK